jgi:putative nucleotidyltransferase with HDIG domain
LITAKKFPDMNETPEDLANRLSAAVDKMPAFPKSVQSILELTRDDDCPLKELVAVIENDPVMTIKLLRILNSAFYGFPKRITSISESVTYLGMHAIKNMALSFAAMDVLPAQNPAGYDVQRLLMHSLTTASVARTLCQQYSQDNTKPADCYIAGLLHDFGKVVFAQFLAREFKQALEFCAEQSISLHAAEQHVIGADHTMVGGMLVEKWNFPGHIADSIRRHHSEISPDNMMLSCLFVADQISRQLALEKGGKNLVEPLPHALAENFGGHLHDIIASLGDVSKLQNEAHIFAQAGDHSISYKFWGVQD